MRSSAIRFVSVVTSTRSPPPTRARISASRSSTWPSRGRTSMIGIDEPRRPDDLLDDLAAGLRQLVVGRRRRHVQASAPIIVSNSSNCSGRLSSADGQAEAVLDQRLLARPVAVVHPADLRHRHVDLVDDEQEIVREVVDAGRAARSPGARPARWPRVVLDAGAVADLAQHLEVVARSAARAAGPRGSFPCERNHCEPLLQLGLDRPDRLLRCDPPASRSASPGRSRRGSARLIVLAGQRIELDDALDLVAEQLDADAAVLVRGAHLDVSPRTRNVPRSSVDVVRACTGSRRGGAGIALRCAVSPTRKNTSSSRNSAGEPRP